MRRLRLATAAAIALCATTIVAAGGEESARAGVTCETGSADFDPIGNVQCYRVPAGVTSVDVTAAGGTGGFGAFVEERRRGARALGGRTGSPGGAGALVTGTIDVEPGQTLYVVVGGNGSSPNQDASGAGGFNGGGDSPVTGLGFPAGGGGGGASDVRTESCAGPDCATNAVSLESRLIVAAGGGGGGFDQDADQAFGGDGGTPDGQSGQPLAGGGAGGTQTSGGVAAGDGSDPGALGSGGDAADFSGGGGSGLWGGGGGGSSSDSGGGGGGSSLVPAGGTSTLDSSAEPGVSIEPAGIAPVAKTLRATNVGCRSAVLNGRISRGGEGIRYRFEYRTGGGALKRTPFRAGPPANPVFKAVERRGGLKRATRYSYRVVAESPGGTDRGEFVRFRTKRRC